MALPNQTHWSRWNFDLQVAANKIEGVYGENQYALNPAIDTVTEDVWQEGGVLSFLSSAETMNVASSSSDDDGDPAGDGARTVTLYGVDGNYLPLKETVVLNGMNNVETENAFLRINRMRVSTVGSDGVNAGDISATASTAGTVQGTISAGLGSTLKSQYTVANGYTAFISNLTLGTDNNDRVLLTLQTRTEGGPWIVIYRINIIDATYFQFFTKPLQVRSKSDIRMQAVKIGGSGTISVTTNYEFYLIKNEYVTQNNPFT
jgi:hypothetical protein